MAKKVNELKKGTQVLLAHGGQDGDLVRCDNLEKALMISVSGGSYHPWEAILDDNKKNGTYRFAKVFGFETEIGTVYSHDIIGYKENGKWKPVEYSKQQIKHKELVMGQMGNPL